MTLVTQISIGRFHHFNAARQLERHGLLSRIWTGYPRFKLKDEEGISPDRISTYPWVQAAFMAKGKIGLKSSLKTDQLWGWLSQLTLDRHVASRTSKPGILFALSQSGLISGKRFQSLGGGWVCDRGSSHIRFQNSILEEEYDRWGETVKPVHPWSIAREEEEYANCDFITVPSEFCQKSFIDMGVDPKKIVKIPYGARLERFRKTADRDPNSFNVLWVGAVSVRKAFLDALHAFQSLKHPRKRFTVVGSPERLISQLLQKENLNDVHFVGQVENAKLIDYYNSAHVFVLSSVEEGLAVVQGEALACGCPIVATYNTGASDLFDHEREGFILPIRRPDLIAESLQQLADDRHKRESMSEAATERVKRIRGWDLYGDSLSQLMLSLAEAKQIPSFATQPGNGELLPRV